MCLAVPARIVKMRENGMADVELEGVIKDVSLELVDGVDVGDYVIVHVGYALARLDPAEAERTLELFANAGAAA